MSQEKDLSDAHATENNQKKGILDKRDTQPEQRARFPHFFANGDGTEVAEGSVQQAWCEQRARLPPSDGNRDCCTDNAEDSHPSTDQLKQRARLPRFHANRHKQTRQQCRSRRSLKTEGPSTRSVQRNPLSSTVNVHSRAERAWASPARRLDGFPLYYEALEWDVRKFPTP